MGFEVATFKNDDEHGRFVAALLWDQQIETTLEGLHGDKLKGFLAELVVRTQNAVRSRFVRGPDGTLVEK